MKKNLLKLILSSIMMIGIGNYASALDSIHGIENHHGETKTDSFKVSGNCGMCKRTIESSMRNADGVKKAEWNADSKIMVVVYDPSHISLDSIKKKIASVGYDTDTVKAS